MAHLAVDDDGGQKKGDGDGAAHVVVPVRGGVREGACEDIARYEAASDSAKETGFGSIFVKRKTHSTKLKDTNECMYDV